jgi:hypothetical protein
MHSKPTLKLEIRAQLIRDGIIISSFPWKPANSLLKQFTQLMHIQLSQINQFVTRTSGATLELGPSSDNLLVTAASAQTSWGMVIGSGTTPVTMLDYKLETQLISNVNHGAMTFAIENPDASTWRTAITRVFTNNTGATLTIREVGLYATTASTYFFCIDRTLYSVDVPSGVGVTFTYRITVSL